jgi:hypothetical protein
MKAVAALDISLPGFRNPRHLLKHCFSMSVRVFPELVSLTGPGVKA